MRLFCALLYLTASSLAQPLTLGVKGAVRITPDMEGSAQSESRPYLIGPMLEVRLPYHFSFEFDALYNRFGFGSTSYDILGGSSIERVRANSWEYPLLAKYHFEGPSLHPYILLGYAPRVTSGKYTYSGYQVDYSTGARAPYRYSGTSRYATDHALIVGGGIELRAGWLRITPEARYLRWKDFLDSYQGSRGYYYLVPQNEVQLLLGVGWSRK